MHCSRRWTSLADGSSAHITDLEPATGVGLDAVHRLKERARRTAISISLGVIAKRFVGEAALRFQAPRSLGLRDIGDNATFLAFL